MAYALLLWGWFQTLATRGHAALAAALVSFIFVCGLVDNLVFFRQIIFLLIVVTAIFILYKGIGNTSTRGFTSSHNM
jgi:O-antigen ligase